MTGLGYNGAAVVPRSDSRGRCSTTAKLYLALSGSSALHRKQPNAKKTKESVTARILPLIITNNN